MVFPILCLCRSPDLVLNSHLMKILRPLLGASLTLKSVHLIQSLPRSTGGGSTAMEPQHWHRDTELLYNPDAVRHSLLLLYSWPSAHRYSYCPFVPAHMTGKALAVQYSAIMPAEARA